MSGPTISDVLRSYEADRAGVLAEPARIPALTKALHQGLGDRPAAQIDQAMINGYVAARQAQGLKLSSVRRETITLLAALRMADIPIQKIKMPPQGRPRMRILTAQEVAALLDATRGQAALHMFVALALATGARRTAICELTWDRVDLVNRIIDLHAPHPRAHRRKGRAVVPISDQLADILTVARPADGQGRLVGVSTSSINKAFNEARDRARLGQDVTPHVLRHTAATMMVRSVPIIFASKMLGHRSTAITEAVYTHLRAEYLRSAADAIGAMLLSPKPPDRSQPPSLVQRLRTLFR